MNGHHNNHHSQQFPRFSAQPNAYVYNTTPYQTPSLHYPYSTPSLSQQQQQQQQQQQPPPSSFFPSLQQTSPATGNHHPPAPAPARHTPQSAPNLRQVHHNRSSPLPSSPGNGPGAPPPERHSPTFEDDLLNALQNSGEQGHRSHPTNDDDEDDEDGDDDDDDQDVVDGDEPVYQLPPPPETQYPNEVELEKAIHAWSLEHGYELVRRASKRNAKGQLYKRYYHCSRHGRRASARTPDKDKVRINRKSNRIGCPMSLAAVSVNPHDPSGNWQIRLRKTHHNHPAVNAAELAGHRRRARLGAVEKAVDGLFAINTSTQDVLKFLQRTHAEGLFKRTDVANMKLKWKKYGSCAHQAEGGQSEVTPQSTPTTMQRGIPSACRTCRVKKTKCDSQRPTCGTCVKSGSACQYDPPARTGQQQQPLPPAPPNRIVQPQSTPSNSALRREAQRQATAGAAGADSMQIDSTPLDFNLSNQVNDANANNTPGQKASQTAQTQQMLAAIAAFQQEHIKPTRLELSSSAVEVLAASTCGSGDSYRSAIPHPFSMLGDWKQFREAFESAAVKENCVDVLRGHKREPEKPEPADGQRVIEVEVHNEYVKQLAIFKRRNEMLKLGFRETLAPALWSRLKSLSDAHEIWVALGDMCCPRGSDQAYTRFRSILDVTFQACGNHLDNYIQTLELMWGEFNEMAHTHESRRATSQLNMSAAEVLKRKIAGNGTFPEEMLCFLFLKNLGPQHQALATNMCKKNNIGGFGTGERCGFKDLWTQVKKALER